MFNVGMKIILLQSKILFFTMVGGK